jgi:hypothetical protein
MLQAATLLLRKPRTQVDVVRIVLGELLPRPASSGQHLDLSKMTDADLEYLEGLHARCGTDVPPPGSHADKVRELCDANAELLAMAREAKRLREIAEQSEATYRRLSDDARLQNGELRAEVERLKADVKASAQNSPLGVGQSVLPENGSDVSLDEGVKVAGPSGGGANVIPLTVKGSLVDRYPSLLTDPVR